MQWTDLNIPLPENKDKLYVLARAYPMVVKGKRKTDQLVTDRFDRNNLFYDPAALIDTTYLNEIKGAIGRKVCYMHDTNHIIGRVFHSWVDKSNCMWVILELPNNAESLEIEAKIKSGFLTGVSVGYRLIHNRKDPTKVDRVHWEEISIVDEPFFDSALIATTVRASKSGNIEIYIGKEKFFFY